MFESLKDIIRPIRARDPLFGDLRYLRDAKFWEGKVSVAAIGRDVEVLVAGDPTGPTEAQRRFFHDAMERYGSVWPAVRQKLVIEASRVGAPSVTEFVLVCVNVPERVDPASEWSLSYETQPASWHFTVSMRGWTPGDVVAEC